MKLKHVLQKAISKILPKFHVDSLKIQLATSDCKKKKSDFFRFFQIFFRFFSDFFRFFQNFSEFFHIFSDFFQIFSDFFRFFSDFFRYFQIFFRYFQIFSDFFSAGDNVMNLFREKFNLNLKSVITF